jgi:chromosome segregation ATPase
MFQLTLIDMTHKKATDQAVFAAADALLSQDIEPTLKLLQTRTGGSYTTVQDAFARWKETRAAEQQQEPAPPEMTAKAEQFARLVWHLAKQQAELSVQEVRRGAHLAAQTARDELAHAQEQIRNLEQERSGHFRQLEDARAAVERERIHAQSQAKRLEHLEAEVSRNAQAMDDTRLDGQRHLVRAAALEGQCETLKKQLSELLQAVRGTPGDEKRKKAEA